MRNLLPRQRYNASRSIDFYFIRAASVVRRRVTHLRSVQFHGSPVYQPSFAVQHILLSYVGSFLGIAALAFLSSNSGYPMIAAPFGATAVLVFGVPDSPLAQPRNVIGGNFLAAVVCVTVLHLFW